VDVDLSRSLLDPLTDNQQRFVDLVGEVYASKPGTWPVFDYVQRTLDHDRIDAIETFESFPTVMVLGGSYRAIWSGGGLSWPHADQVIVLTVIGMHHCSALRGRFPRDFSIPEVDLPTAFFTLVRWAARELRAAMPSPTEVLNTEVTSDQVFKALGDRNRFDQLPPRLLWDLMDREPPFWGASGHVDADQNRWSRSLSRNLYDYEDIDSVDTYVARLLLHQPPVRTPAPAAASPFDLVGALDYLNAIWELVFGTRLLQFHAAEPIAKLGYAVGTREEFNAHVSALADVLRQADAGLDAVRVKRGTKKRDRPLVRLETTLVNALGSASEEQMRKQVALLEAILFVREAGQHSAAGQRGAAAMIDLGAGFPPPNWTAAWDVIERRAIDALGAIRDELQAHRAAKAASSRGA
jgi:hypothetical protein